MVSRPPDSDDLSHQVVKSLSRVIASPDVVRRDESISPFCTDSRIEIARLPHGTFIRRAGFASLAMTMTLGSSATC